MSMPSIPCKSSKWVSGGPALPAHLKPLQGSTSLSKFYLYIISHFEYYVYKKRPVTIFPLSVTMDQSKTGIRLVYKLRNLCFSICYIILFLRISQSLQGQTCQVRPCCMVSLYIFFMIPLAQICMI